MQTILVYDVYISHWVEKRFRKLKDKNLKIAINNAIYNKIATNPYEVGDFKVGDLTLFVAYM
ncbi:MULTISPECIES: hypothetical protein [Lactobacillus]|uniref:hypothetical protein n=1 Tax=Lactobacillus TaxID=1578 RepID=UPI001247E131|nr:MULTISPECIES: hypothetical protein [Lactobacillus]KAA9319059.1 hypothetical protein F6H97_07760 [Lactobacillus jensenii]MCZ4009447.1 hypothetical protein [Lactobacillus jensenii]MCZ4012872.1 hypothetical protein [Lactobacillus jensenii]MDX5095044.1 hypothetical protein [Lactobacillus jensenii]MDX5103339.1 hypothetical protein [Lactobacillus jensenii]